MSRKTFTKEKISLIFSSTTSAASGYDQSQIRTDFKGRLIARAAYGQERSDKGWNIHHKDRDKTNNSKSNLIAVHYSTHKEIHNEK